MNKLINQFRSTAVGLAKDEEGAQVVEYALIIAVVSIGLAVALGAAGAGLQASFASLVTRISACFTAGGTCS